MDDIKRISLAEAQRVLGENTMIVLESEEAWQKKVANGKENEAWGFDLGSGAIRRGDQRFFDLRVGVHPGGWPTGFITEEPRVPESEDGQPRVIGHVIIDVNAENRIAVRKAKGLNGEIWELKPSSLSKGELDESGQSPAGYFEANAQRINGTIAIFVNRVDAFPEGTVSMTVAEFAAQSTDGRALSALAKAGLLRG